MLSHIYVTNNICQKDATFLYILVIFINVPNEEHVIVYHLYVFPHHLQVLHFLGIPYGQAPIDDLRFRLPRPVPQWSGVLDTSKHKASACIQWVDRSIPGFAGIEAWNANTPQSEDCLNVNVWTPRDAHDLPVLVWIYGGGFMYGSPSLDLYDGATLAALGNVVVVNINYRVGKTK